MRFALACLLAACLWGADDEATLIVTVKDAATGETMKVDQVILEPLHRQVVYTAGQHLYRFTDIAPGAYRVVATSGERVVKQTKSVALRAGETVNLEFTIPAASSIAGKVTDEDGAPLEAVTVFLLASEYRLGVLRHGAIATALTDRYGDYIFGRGVEAGRTYHLLALKEKVKMPLIADPHNPPHDAMLRPTYYPNTAMLDGSAPVIAAPGEARRVAEIRIPKTDTHCIAGEVDAEGTIDLVLTMAEPDHALSPLHANPGKFQICDVAPGEYVLTAKRSDQIASAKFTLGSQDLTGVHLRPSGAQRLMLDVQWDGDPPDPPKRPDVAIVMILSNGGVAASLFGGNQFISVSPAAEVSLQADRLSKGMYVKSITADGIDIMYKALPVIPGVISTVRVGIARDGGSLNVRVVDHDGKPVPDTNIFVIPHDEVPAAILSAARIAGRGDQYGAYLSGTLVPGKYLVLATRSEIDNTPERIARLRDARRLATEIEISPGATTQINLEPVTIE